MSAARVPLRVEPLSREAFVPFGEVIEAGTTADQFAINGGTSQRFHDLATLEPGTEGRLIVSIFRAQPRALPFPVRMLERHPKASQAFMPLSGRPFLVVVAPAGALDPGAIRAFLAQGTQGVNFAPGTWHHPLLALESVSDFLVIDRDRPEENCDE
ncbi:MAG: ureidoglycolate lyase [Candidatus Dactylopiibacterium carminicum]|nr:MAG: ureidoglycolate lyase [Candidatus Dactylopiibacterium carminicum]